MSKTALVILAEGAEEMEVVIAADVLRRGGIKVTIAGLAGSQPVKGCMDIVIVPDASIDDALKQGPYDAVVLPGGLKGPETLAESAVVKKILQEQEKNGGIIAAICYAPVALKSHSIGVGKSLTSHSDKRSILSGGQYKYLEERVVVDGQLITSRAPGTAFEFALAIVEHMVGKEKADSLVGPMFVKK